MPQQDQRIGGNCLDVRTAATDEQQAWWAWLASLLIVGVKSNLAINKKHLMYYQLRGSAVG